MKEWINDEFCMLEDEFVDVAESLDDSSRQGTHYDARRRLEMLLEEKMLRDDLDDYLFD